MIKINDQIGQSVQLNGPAKRIVCLVPSITELIWHLGLEEELVGRTKFCIFPKILKEKVPQVGGTKQVHVDRIEALQPDLIICNKEENTEEIVASLKGLSSIYVSNIQTIHSALEMISDIGQLTGKVQESETLVNNIEAKRLEWHSQSYPQKSCLYLIWKNPYMTIGVDTYIYNMLAEMNFESALYDFRYPEVSIEQIKKMNPAYLLLSSEPFPFRQKDIEELQEQLPGIKAILVDGTYFSWYGNRILDAYPYFEALNEQLAKK